MDEEKTKEKTEEVPENKTDTTPAEEAGTKEEKIPAVEEAKKAALDIKAENDRREKILEEEKKVLDRKESLSALGGGSPGGTESKPSKTPEEIASREKIKKVGDATGAQWAKDMHKEDGD